MPDPTFLTLYRFEVALQPRPSTRSAGTLARAAFSEVTGLEINREHTEIREGGYHHGVRQLAGKTSNPVLVLKRGATLDAGFWRWIQDSLAARFPLPYLDGTVTVRADDPNAAPVRFRWVSGIVTKVKHADLNAASATAVPVEELHIAHEGLERVLS